MYSTLYKNWSLIDTLDYYVPQRRGKSEFFGKIFNTAGYIFNAQNITSMDGKTKKRLCIGRMFWMLSFMASMLTALYLIYQMWKSYRNHPIVTLFNPRDIPIGALPFPAITICNINNVQKSKVESYISQASKPHLTDDELIQAYSDLYNLEHICQNHITFMERLALDYEHFTLDQKLKAEILKRKLEIESADPIRVLREASQKCSEMILYCIWMDELQNCSTLFHEIETDYGYCCSFNLMPVSLLLKLRNDSRDNEHDIKVWADAKLNSENILLLSDFDEVEQEVNNNHEMFYKKHVLPKYLHRQIFAGRSSGLSILLYADLDEYNCTNTDSEGFTISMNLPLDYPRLKDSSIAIPSGSEVFVNIRPEITIPDDSIKGFDIDKRKCYFGDEFELKYYSHYTTSNCIDECIANWTLFECQCVHYYMPRKENETLCPPTKYHCTEDVRKQLIQRGVKKTCRQCLPTCTDLEYSSETTFLKIKNTSVNKLMKDGRLDSKIKPSDLSIVHLYFGVDSTFPRQRKELYGIIEFLSNAGGLLSLCVGFSIIKLIHLLYNFIVRIIYERSDNDNAKHDNSLPSFHEARNERIVSPMGNGFKNLKVFKIASTRRNNSNIIPQS